jgi:hypothetical protein
VYNAEYTVLINLAERERFLAARVLEVKVIYILYTPTMTKLICSTGISHLKDVRY